jgi:hypothetical protein
MAKKEQDILPPGKKKLQNTSKPPELLAKSGTSFLSSLKKEQDDQKELYSKPIFKTKRFDLL